MDIGGEAKAFGGNVAAGLVAGMLPAAAAGAAAGNALSSGCVGGVSLPYVLTVLVLAVPIGLIVGIVLVFAASAAWEAHHEYGFDDWVGYTLIGVTYVASLAGLVALEQATGTLKWSAIVAGVFALPLLYAGVRILWNLVRGKTWDGEPRRDR